MLLLEHAKTINFVQIQLASKLYTTSTFTLFHYHKHCVIYYSSLIILTVFEIGLKAIKTFMVLPHQSKSESERESDFACNIAGNVANGAVCKSNSNRNVLR